jgi:hypothetical protein
MSLFGSSWGRCTVPTGFAAPPVRLVNVMPAVERWEDRPSDRRAPGLKPGFRATGAMESKRGGLPCPRHILIEEEHK